ncbi:UDP-glucuronic acid decarboxylase family protein [Methyloligella sp. 2.7D]|uniref:UDP-glucuronic acid decarboxylase family protein n=1 Tax=unclassified Methyloligella TaxID=2625955 RepID=UPI00157DC6FC|nr:UDP-glucuronic acid decarboxylase family protein [Methyloligella sp. GL2]QKP78030.1 SDR family oxidoreductase [Methyloligella sp. GL2]
MQSKNIKRVLVSGGAGFIGSHLVDRLLSSGHSVICVDDLTSGSLSKIRQRDGEPRFTFIQQDVCVPLSAEVDEIYNLASLASPARYNSDQIQTAKTNLLGPLNMLELATRTNAKIFQASTSEVYGNPVMHPQDESYWGNVNPVGPRSCYVETKRCAETLFFDYHRVHALDIKIARLFNVYGPGMRADDGRVVSNFIVNALIGQDLAVNGDGRQTRSFCYVDDLIEGLVRLMETPAEVTGPMNIGNPQEISVRDLADMIIDLTGSRSRVSEVPALPEEPVRRCPDISNAELTLDWKPNVGLEQGLRRTIDYFDHLLTQGESR